jgi:hypothetical protein
VLLILILNIIYLLLVNDKKITPQLLKYHNIHYGTLIELRNSMPLAVSHHDYRMVSISLNLMEMKLENMTL